MSQYKPYPAYKDSGVEWLGWVPKEWKLIKFNWAATIRNGQVDPRADPYADYPLIAPNHVESETGRLLALEAAADQGADSGKYLCKPGEVIYSKIRPALAKACLSPCLSLCSADMYPIAPTSELRADFLLWFLLSRPFTRFAVLESNRVAMPKVNRETLALCKIPVPHLLEQASIAVFLGRETARIDALIEKKQRLIELLKEKRQAVITQAVTKGLDPKVPMKDSGVEWLGEVPEHWVAAKLQRLLKGSPKNGVSPPATDEWGIPTFSISAVRAGKVHIAANLKFADMTASDAQPYLVKKGDVFMLRGNGNRKFVGKAGLVLEEPPSGCVYPDILIRIAPISELLVPEYLVQILSSEPVRKQIEDSARTAAGIWKISGGSVSSLRVPVPPYSEQVEILQFLQKKLTRFDTTISKTEASITLLQEHRSALITAAVTGQIDVRDAV